MAEEDVIRSLRRAFALRGTSVSEDEVLGVALEALRRTARSCLGYFRGKTPTYQTDELLSEVVEVLFGKEQEWESADHFVNWSWQVALRLHLSHRQHRRRKKRAGGYHHTPIEEVDAADPSSVLDVDLISLRAALEELEKTLPLEASVITHRFLLGCSVEETAGLLGIAERTVSRKTRVAKAWLARQL